MDLLKPTKISFHSFSSPITITIYTYRVEYYRLLVTIATNSLYNTLWISVFWYVCYVFVGTLKVENISLSFSFKNEVLSLSILQCFWRSVYF